MAVYQSVLYGQTSRNIGTGGMIMITPFDDVMCLTGEQ